MNDPNPASVSYFPQTLWTHVREAAVRDAPAGREALETLCFRYREPARRFLRALGCPPEEAEDIVQDFLVKISSPGALQHLAPEHGRLRHYVKEALRNLAANQWRKNHTLKRGGGQTVLSLDELSDFQVHPIPAEAEATYDSEWALALLQRVMASVRQDYACRERAQVFDLLSPSLGLTESLKPYADLGVALGMKEAQIKIEVYRLRRRFGEALRQEVATTALPEEIDDEIRHILKAASHVRTDT